jgi:titin
VYLIYSCTDTPGKPEVLDVTKNAVTLVWTRPKNDGGSKIIGYYVEALRLPGDKWVRCNTSSQNVPREEYTATGLEEDMEYQFRVIAKTAVNMSRASDITDPVLVSAEKGRNSALTFVSSKLSTYMYIPWI